MKLLMRAGLISLGLAAVLIGAIYAWGAMLPRDHTAQASAIISADRAAVFARIADVEAGPTWRSDVAAVERLASEDGAVRFLERGAYGDIAYVVVESAPPRHRVVRILDEGLDFGGTWTFELADAPSGTTVTITEDGFVKDPVMRVFGALFFPPDATMKAYLGDLAASFADAEAPSGG